MSETAKVDEEDWTTFSDAEVMGRLLRRGIEPVTAKGWVRDREQEWAADEITEVLTQVILDENDKPVRLEVPIDRRPRR